MYSNFYKKKFTINLVLSFLICCFISSFFLPNAKAQYERELITSKYAILIDANTGVPLFEKDSELQAFPASTTKIMTAIIVIENITDFEEVLTSGEEIRGFGPESSMMGLIEHEKVRIIDLLHGLMLLSGNDSAKTLAVRVGGNISGFADLMNAKASQLGMTNSHFVNPHGLHVPEHYTTAKDLAILTRYAMQNEKFRKIVSTKYYNLPATNKHSTAREIKNTNRFLTSDDYAWSAVTGVKTGSTGAAQGCLVTAASQDGKDLICVVLGDGSPGSEKRWSESKSLLQFGFDNLEVLPLSQLDPENITVEILEASRRDAKKGSLELKIETTDKVISGLAPNIEAIKADPSLLQITHTLDSQELIAPIKQGEIVGSAAVKQGDVTLAVVNLVATRDVNSQKDDPPNIVDNFIQGVVKTPKNKVSPIFIALLVVIIFLLLLLIVIILNKRRLRRLRRDVRKKRTNYYNYKIK